ncbi:MAG: adenylate/guanylate cyclase domain-containing protein [Bacteroidota bacterium]
MKVHRKRQLSNIFILVIAYTIIGAVVSVYDYFLLNSELSRGPSKYYRLLETLMYNAIAGFSAGLLGGTFLTALNRRIKAKSFSYGQMLGAFYFLVLFFFLSTATAIVTTYNIVGLDLSNPKVLEVFKVHFFSSLHLKNLILWITVFQLTQFWLQLQQKFGPGNLWKMFLGKYHKPRTEPRIFMFLDLKSSTTIAEKLGESKYHQFLQDVFSDITEPISESKAEIYQYVGDEIIITWHVDKIKEKNRCLNIFFDIQKEFESKREEYLEKYNTIPKFKAGAHTGTSVVGEIGIIKRDITYSGDLLNTTARIQGKCNDFGSMFLISGQLKNYLADSSEKWDFSSEGFINLRGKESKIELYTVSI